ncbi:Golgi-associated plant pathogenesis-related protein 1-like [Tenrec ecaudatus]|uniref:Golgi-associated plant pathogenesis-related protein 1-like n=1 Tax=Tenrec ecaudatus TaxID=94439 RepID=UPI003F591197
MGKSASKFNKGVPKAHKSRQKHGVPPLKLCKKPNQETQQTLHSHGVEEHQEDGGGQGFRQ